MQKILLCLALLFNGNIKAQIKNLVFEGAGIRGIAYAGAIKKLEEKGVLQGIEKVGGTSAGAIIALLLSLGYTADEIKNLIITTPFKKFNDGRFLFLGGIQRVKKYYGWYRGKQFEKWLDALIEQKTGNANISFEELHNRGYKDLFITGTSLDEQKLIVFSHKQFPKMQVKDAVRISMSIPLYFEAVFMNEEGKIIQHPKNKKGLHVMVDGGIIANFPIRVFDSTLFIDSALPNGFVVNTHTIGFRIDRAEQIANDSAMAGLAKFRIENFNNYLEAFYSIIIENLNRQDLTKEDWDRTVSINDGGINPRIKKLPKKKIQQLITNGEKATANYLSNHLFLNNEIK
jgi:NTE family protein